MGSERESCSEGLACTTAKGTFSRSSFPSEVTTDAEVVSSFLQMVRDASFSFPAPNYTIATSNLASASPASFSQQPSAGQTTSRENGSNYALNLGPVSLNVDHRVGNTLEAATDAARDGLKDLFGKVRSRVDGVRLN